MAFPTNLTNAVDGVTDVLADHLNNLEAKVGIDGSLVTTSLDYLLKHPASVDPGHVHSGYQVAGSYITALTGDVAASGPGSPAATIQAGAVNLSKMANLAANSIIGNNTADSATPLALSVAQVKSLLAITQADVNGLTTASEPTFANLSIYKDSNSEVQATFKNVNAGTGARASFAVLSDSNVGMRFYQFSSGYTPSALFTPSKSLMYASGSGGVLLGASHASGIFQIFTGGLTTGNIRLTVNAAGNVGIGTASPNGAALLHLSSTTKGFLPPVMTSTQKNAIGAPPAGLVVYDSTLNKLCVYTGAAWETITSS
jgi:hypothetical protein